MASPLPTYLQGHRETLNREFPHLHYSFIKGKLFIYRKGAGTPFCTFLRDGQFYVRDETRVSTIRDALQWADRRR